ncbi:MAG: hypothetical protein ACP5HZ_12440 [Ferrimicrobium sp.]|uniref:hypothetical protein n=1 Tax=Ferrimicrobium sp. TaxID=2926050 RepID=UPI00261A9F99|nr:hypothetical protein [Ferrimicrobium sp.]
MVDAINLLTVGKVLGLDDWGERAAEFVRLFKSASPTTQRITLDDMRDFVRIVEAAEFTSITEGVDGTDLTLQAEGDYPKPVIKAFQQFIELSVIGATPGGLEFVKQQALPGVCEWLSGQLGVEL